MTINQTLSFVFLIVISFVSECAWSHGSQQNAISYKTMGSKCWNGLGTCDDLCDGERTRKIDYTCEELNTCCVAKRMVIPVNSVEKQTELVEGQKPCALGNGKCNVKCMAPTTVYQGSVNECPIRYFCCINNPTKSEGKGPQQTTTEQE